MTIIPYMLTIEGHPVYLNQEYITRGGTKIVFTGVREERMGRNYLAYRYGNGSESSHDWMFDGKIGGYNGHDYDVMRPVIVKPDFNTVEDISSAFRFMQMREKELRG